MIQKLHGWLQPSAIFRYAKCFGVSRNRGVSKSGMKVGRAVTSNTGADAGFFAPTRILVLPNFSEPRMDSSFSCAETSRFFSSSLRRETTLDFGLWALDWPLE